MKRALIIGADSVIGAALKPHLEQNGWSVAGTSRRNDSSALFLDLAADDVASTELPAVDVAFFCASMSRFAECREQPELTRHVNVIAPVGLATQLVAAGTRVVLLSTSAVFDGLQPFSTIDRPACPTSAYGRQKAEAEAHFLALGGQATVLRLTKVIHDGFPLFAKWREQLSQGASIRAFSDLTIAPVLPEHVTTALEAVTRDTHGGIFHVSGAKDLSYFEAGHLLADQMGVDAALVYPAKSAEAALPPDEVLAFTSLNCARLTALSGFQPPKPQAILSRFLCAKA